MRDSTPDRTKTLSASPDLSLGNMLKTNDKVGEKKSDRAKQKLRGKKGLARYVER